MQPVQPLRQLRGEPVPVSDVLDDQMLPVPDGVGQLTGDPAQEAACVPAGCSPRVRRSHRSRVNVVDASGGPPHGEVGEKVRAEVVREGRGPPLPGGGSLAHLGGQRPHPFPARGQVAGPDGVGGQPLGDGGQPWEWTERRCTVQTREQDCGRVVGVAEPSVGGRFRERPEGVAAVGLGEHQVRTQAGPRRCVGQARDQRVGSRVEVMAPAGAQEPLCACQEAVLVPGCRVVEQRRRVGRSCPLGGRRDGRAVTSEDALQDLGGRGRARRLDQRQGVPVCVGC